MTYFNFYFVAVVVNFIRSPSLCLLISVYFHHHTSLNENCRLSRSMLTILAHSLFIMISFVCNLFQLLFGPCPFGMEKNGLTSQTQNISHSLGINNVQLYAFMICIFLLFHSVSFLMRVRSLCANSSPFPFHLKTSKQAK